MDVITQKESSLSNSINERMISPQRSISPPMESDKCFISQEKNGYKKTLSPSIEIGKRLICPEKNGYQITLAPPMESDTRILDAQKKGYQKTLSPPMYSDTGLIYPPKNAYLNTLSPPMESDKRLIYGQKKSYLKTLSRSIKIDARLIYQQKKGYKNTISLQKESDTRSVYQEREGYLKISQPLENDKRPNYFQKMGRTFSSPRMSATKYICTQREEYPTKCPSPKLNNTPKGNYPHIFYCPNKESNSALYLQDSIQQNLQKKEFIHDILESVNPITAITIWNNGNKWLAPLKSWSYDEMLCFKTRYDQIRIVNEIFAETFNHEFDFYMPNCKNRTGGIFTLDEFLAKQRKTYVDRAQVYSLVFHEKHKSMVQSSVDQLYVLPRKINGRKVSAVDVIQLWYKGIHNIKPIKNWCPQQKLRQQTKICRWKKIIDIFEAIFMCDIEKFIKHFTTRNGKLLPITTIIGVYQAKNATLAM